MCKKFIIIHIYFIVGFLLFKTGNSAEIRLKKMLKLHTEAHTAAVQSICSAGQMLSEPSSIVLNHRKICRLIIQSSYIRLVRESCNTFFFRLKSSLFSNDEVQEYSKLVNARVVKNISCRRV